MEWREECEQSREQMRSAILGNEATRVILLRAVCDALVYGEGRITASEIMESLE